MSPAPRKHYIMDLIDIEVRCRASVYDSSIGGHITRRTMVYDTQITCYNYSQWQVNGGYKPNLTFGGPTLLVRTIMSQQGLNNLLSVCLGYVGQRRSLAESVISLRFNHFWNDDPQSLRILQVACDQTFWCGLFSTLSFFTCDQWLGWLSFELFATNITN